jgi:3-deoxy-7-phosphoheptulonate synthase
MCESAAMKPFIEMKGYPVSETWTPSSWRAHPVGQAFIYPVKAELDLVELGLSGSSPLVAEHEIEQLAEKLFQVEKGEAFLLQGGDCAESFLDPLPETPRNNYHLLRRMAEILTSSLKIPVIKIGRIAGQFSKPRSSEFEGDGRGGVLPVYRGDMFNGFNLNLEERRPDPKRLERAYSHSVEVSNILRNLAIKSSENRDGQATLFTSHEALHLPYEQSLTRKSKLREGRYYAGSGHMVWVGDRTRHLQGAHVEYTRGILNPIGLKCGPELKADALLALIDRLNPENTPGHLTLITRFGARGIAGNLPRLIRRVQEEGRRVIWCCDPMHGNTFLTKFGVKTRSVSAILSEVKTFVEIHKAEGTFPGGIHLELTGQPVLECVMDQKENAGDCQIESASYKTLCDPRLNEAQALIVASSLADFILPS